MDSIEPTTTHSWILILRVGKTHIHVIKIYQTLSTRVFSQFIRPPYTQFRLHIHRFVVTRHLIMWPPTRAQPLSRPDQHHPHPYHTRAQPLDPSSHHTLNLQADCFSCSVHSLTCTQVHSQWQARAAISQSNRTTITITEFFCEHINSFYIPQTKGNACACFLSHAVINSSIYLNYNFPNCQKSIKPKWQYKLRDKRFFLLWSATSFRPSSHSSCRYSPFSHSSAMDHWN